jgi:hypothetical protein
MASPTRKLKVRKRLKNAKLGLKRKNHDRVHGSTAPNLPLDKPNANERAQKKTRA